MPRGIVRTHQPNSKGWIIYTRKLDWLLDLRSYQHCFQFVTVRIHGDFKMLPHWKTRPPAPRTDILPSHIILTLGPCPILIVPSTWLESDKYTFLSHWFDFTRVRTRAVRIPQSSKQGYMDALFIQPSGLVNKLSKLDTEAKRQMSNECLGILN